MDERKSPAEVGRSARPPISVRSARFPAVVVGLALFLSLSAASAGCGSGVGGMFDMGEMHDQMHSGGGGVPQTPVVADASQVTVEIRELDFFPRDLTVEAGTKVTWVNRDSVPHDATVEGSWSTGILKQEASATLTFDSAGVYRYLCTIHPNMKANLTIE